MKKYTMYVLLIFTVIPSLHALKKKRLRRKNNQLVIVCKAGATFTKKHVHDTYDFYKRFFSGQCTKKERKKAKKNLRWYRNAAFIAAAAYGVKWKIDTTKLELEHYIHNHLADDIAACLDNPGPYQIKIESAIKRKVGHEVGQAIEGVKRRVYKNPVVLFVISLFGDVSATS